MYAINYIDLYHEDSYIGYERYTTVDEAKAAADEVVALCTRGNVTYTIIAV